LLHFYFYFAAAASFAHPSTKAVVTFAQFASTYSFLFCTLA
jgi:hypothetical protein